MNFFENLKEKLKKTCEVFSSKFKDIFAFFTKVDDEFLDKLEEALIRSDVSVSASKKIKEKLRKKAKLDRLDTPEQIADAIKVIIENILYSEEKKTNDAKIIMFVGVNGVGKTTSIGKMAFLLSKNGKKVLLAAADTFRAAAVEQLEIWSKRANCEIISKKEGADPGAVVFEAIEKMKSENFDVILCDTAGRLHNKSDLMAELAKIERIIDKKLPDAKKETFLVLDGNTGQNMLMQTEEFLKFSKITGIILTKLDGTAHGGAVISAKERFGIPIKYIGIGESPKDFKEFDAKEFTKALFSDF
ncbi:MAG: signal recognition particle-docking protein FtsY [Oscillospiraceae bacterium]|jgi:fused signal recognition particle receptor|nr:signal recognition particle-docking protein FtsY [Oscillospiraceae bacterium]